MGSKGNANCAASGRQLGTTSQEIKLEDTITAEAWKTDPTVTSPVESDAVVFVFRKIADHLLTTYWAKKID
jgi:hypothetical protein